MYNVAKKKFGLYNCKVQSVASWLSYLAIFYAQQSLTSYRSCTLLWSAIILHFFCSIVIPWTWRMRALDWAELLTLVGWTVLLFLELLHPISSHSQKHQSCSHNEDNYSYLRIMNFSHHSESEPLLIQISFNWTLANPIKANKTKMKISVRDHARHQMEIC